MSKPSKRGLAWPVENQDPTHIFTHSGSKVSWLYNWSPVATPDSSLSFIPMQWNHVNIDDLPEKISASGARTLLGFNEPELDSQSNIPASLAAKEWIRVIEPLRKQGIRVGSPGISSAPDGVKWLKEFLTTIRQGGSDIDFYAIHWYGEGLGPFYDYIWSTHHYLGPDKPMWITEFACTNWNTTAPLAKDVVEEFCKESCKYLDTLDWVERYAWFGAMKDCGTVGRWARMIGDDGQLTELGKWYRDQ
jgi:hypothetical protein